MGRLKGSRAESPAGAWTVRSSGWLWATSSGSSSVSCPRGYRQRVAIAQACWQSDVLILDEPTTASTRRQIIEMRAHILGSWAG